MVLVFVYLRNVFSITDAEIIKFSGNYAFFPGKNALFFLSKKDMKPILTKSKMQKKNIFPRKNAFLISNFGLRIWKSKSEMQFFFAFLIWVGKQNLICVQFEIKNVLFSKKMHFFLTFFLTSHNLSPTRPTHRVTYA